MGWTTLSRPPGRLILASLGLSGLRAAPAMASVASGGSSLVPLTPFAIDLYNVTNGVYLPLIALGAIAWGGCALLFGWHRFGGIAGRVVGVIGLVVLGVAGIARWFGGNSALAMLLS